jgi:HEPN domain-containing protein
MSETVKEWVAKAEGDYGVAARELAILEDGNSDAACFQSP